jgi:hypothetical protein
MSKIAGFLLMAAIAVSIPLTAFAHTAEAPFVTQLIAGGGNPASAIDVGEVRVWNDTDYIYVKYVIDADLTPGDPSDDWVLTTLSETHLHVADSLDGIPQTAKGNPIPGKFEYSMHHTPGTQMYVYQIPNTWTTGNILYIAAHAVVQKGGEQGLTVSLPALVHVCVYPPVPGGPSYFPDLTLSGGTILDGTYDAWCADTDHNIDVDCYDALVYSIYGTLPSNLIDYPDNLDLVNWLLNQDFVGNPSACDGIYTYGDVQRAIWTLLEDYVPDDSYLGDWSPCRVAEIVAAAYANGEGFAPGCGQRVAIVLAPYVNTTILQAILITIDMPCEFDETAWAGDDGEMQFPGANWATYFTYEVQ